MSSPSPSGRMMAKSFEEDLRQFERTIDKEQQKSRSRSSSVAKANANPQQVTKGFSVSADSQQHSSGGPPHDSKQKKGKMTKAERREMTRRQQEAAAAKKAQQGGGGGGSKKNKGGESKQQQKKQSSERKKNKNQRKGSDSATSGSSSETGDVPLFRHLPPFRKLTSTSVLCQAQGMLPDEMPHPAVLKLGLQYAHGHVSGSTARAVALIEVLKQVLAAVGEEGDKPFYRTVDLELKRVVQFLVDCRPQSVSMGNVINYLKSRIQHCTNKSVEDARSYLCSSLDQFLEERIVPAAEVICREGSAKIVDGDVLLTHACSVAVERVLMRAHEDGKVFRVIVLDSNPKREGLGMTERLAAVGLNVTYALINACSYMLSGVTKVFLGAYAMLANGSLLSRVGSSIVAMMAHNAHIPVIVCCETMKFSERVVVDSITFNELGDPEELLRNGPSLGNWKGRRQLHVLNISYDVTPVQYLSLVVCEVGLVPPSSVPIIMREYHK